MTGISISFTADIYAYATTRGLDLTRDEVKAISANLNSITSVDGTTASFKLGGDRAVSLGEAVEAMSAGYGRPAAAKSPGRSIPANASATQRAILTNQAVKAGSDATKQQQAETLVRSFGNPWRTGNATHRAYVTNTHPTLASRLKAEAGART